MGKKRGPYKKRERVSWYLRNRTKILEERKAWYDNNRERLIKERAENPEKRRKYRDAELKYKYGIDSGSYDTLRSEQDNKCVICGIEKDVLCVDHNHKTGAIRGLLCFNCNKGLGMFRDSSECLIRAAKYITDEEKLK